MPEEVLRVDPEVDRIPDGLSFAEASLTEPLACVLNGQGAGPGGRGRRGWWSSGRGRSDAFTCRLARARGAAKIILVDLNADRLPTAAALVLPDVAIAGDDPVDRGARGHPADVAPTS